MLKPLNGCIHKLTTFFQKHNRPRTPSKGFISVEVKYTPAKRPLFINTPVLQPKEWDLDVACPQCNNRYSVIGTAYFCPFCGKNNIEENFEKSLEVIHNKLNFKELFKNDLEKMDKNMAEDFARSILEKTVGETVSAFQKLAELLIKKHTDKEVKVNDFQIILKGDSIFTECVGKSYKDWISADEYSFLDLMFQRRHLLEHNLGIVDEKYLERTKDTSYHLGERLILNVGEISSFIGIIRKLSHGLKGYKKSSKFGGLNRFLYF